jgi:dTMP kinase
MPTSAMTAEMPPPLWVTIEGLNGVGKTHLARQLTARLGDSCRMISELTDVGGEELTGQVIAALTRPGGTFLRTGHPLTETFALLALKILEYERAGMDQTGVSAFIEDRGVDSVAVYQAAVLCPAGPASHLVRRIHETAAMWRPRPGLTLMLVDDFDTCLNRYSARLGEPVSVADRRLLATVAGLYTDLARDESHRIKVVDRAGRSELDVLAEMERYCRAAGAIGVPHDR